MSNNPREGAFCASTIHTTNDELTCAKRPHRDGPHVGLRADGSVRWWGGDDDAVRGEIRLLGGPLLDAALRPVPPASETVLPPSKATRSIEARGLGFTGDMCGRCGSMRVIKTGTCGTCSDCGEPGSCG